MWPFTRRSEMWQRRDDGYDIGFLMSDFEDNIDPKVAQRLVNDPRAYARYSSGSFYVMIWFAKGEFHCELWEGVEPVAYMSNKDAQSLCTKIKKMSMSKLSKM